MIIRRLHRTLGILLICPFLAWAVTGMIFFIKPGYQKAYAPLPVPKLAVEKPVEIPVIKDAFEIKYFQTSLGPSLMVQTKNGWQHLDPITLEAKPEPNQEQFQKLVNQAIETYRDRYGEIAKIQGLEATTTTGVRITLNWQHMRFSQYGKDTARIDWYYKVHYLQWTGLKMLDRILGFVGLILVMLMALTGFRLLFRRKKPHSAQIGT